MILTEAPAEFLTPLSDQTVTEFETAVFECEISKANLKVKWTKGGEVIEANKHFEMANIGNKYMLTVREAELTDQDKYRIIAEDGVESQAKLKVKGK